MSNSAQKGDNDLFDMENKSFFSCITKNTFPKWLTMCDALALSPNYLFFIFVIKHLWKEIKMLFCVVLHTSCIGKQFTAKL